jgi:D-beta-D-heptose 7-phosphate kinase/D-beta-D-heptose 1-phosphate adenosyltransferase
MKEGIIKKIKEIDTSKKILVIGDLILDQYIFGKVKRISPEAPVPVVEVEKNIYIPGGAANVANNISSLGGRAIISGVIGEDGIGRILKEELLKKKIDISGIVIEKNRPTSLKTRVIAHSQQVVRIDREKKEEIGKQTIKKILQKIEKFLKEVEVVVFSDYNKGMAEKNFVREIVKISKKFKKKIIVDPKPQNFEKFKNVTILTPNQQEAILYSHIEISDRKTLEKVAKKIMKNLKLEALLITRGEKGMSLFTEEKSIHIPAVTSEVYDVTGAGDTVVGALSVFLAAGFDLFTSVKLANYAAGVVVRKLGTATVTLGEILEILEKYE